MQMRCRSNNGVAKDAAAATSTPAANTRPRGGAEASPASTEPDDAPSTPPPPVETSPDATTVAAPPVESDTGSAAPPAPSPSPTRTAPSDDVNVDGRAPDPLEGCGGSAPSTPRHRSPGTCDDDAVGGDGASSFASSAAVARHGGTSARFGRERRPLGVRAPCSPQHRPSASPGHGGKPERFDPPRVDSGRRREIPRGSRPTSTPSPMEADANRGREGPIAQPRPRDNDNPGPFDRAFRRQQEILRGAHLALDVSRGQWSPAMKSPSPVQQQWRQWPHSRQVGPIMQSSSMQEQQWPHHSRPRRIPKVDQANAVQNLLGVDTFSSRSHPLVIANALRALDSSNNPAMLLSKDSAPPRGEGSRQAQGLSHAAMQAQLRRLEEQVTGRTSALEAVEHAPGATTRSEDAHAAMLARMIRLDKELKAQRVVLAAGEGSKEKAGGCGAMSQGDVARLREVCSRRRPRDSVDASGLGGVSGRCVERKHPRSVRRASAA